MDYLASLWKVITRFVSQETCIGVTAKNWWIYYVMFTVHVHDVVECETFNFMYISISVEFTENEARTLWPK